MSQNPVFRTIVGVPGPWQNSQELVRAVASSQNGYIYAGLVLLHTETSLSLGLELYNFDPNLTEAFRIASQGRMSAAELEAIQEHKTTAYLIGNDLSVETSKAVMDAASALLDLGGLGVKVESAGVAHSKDAWQQFAATKALFEMYEAYVTLARSESFFYSCGMHNLGLADVMVSNRLSPQTAAELLNEFNMYCILEAPHLKSGQTFSVSQDAPVFRMTHGPCTLFEAGDPFHNPFGVWVLTAVER